MVTYCTNVSLPPKHTFKHKILNCWWCIPHYFYFIYYFVTQCSLHGVCFLCHGFHFTSPLLFYILLCHPMLPAWGVCFPSHGPLFTSLLLFHILHCHPMLPAWRVWFPSHGPHFTLPLLFRIFLCDPMLLAWRVFAQSWAPFHLTTFISSISLSPHFPCMACVSLVIHELAIGPNPNPQNKKPGNGFAMTCVWIGPNALLCTCVEERPGKVFDECASWLLISGSTLHMAWTVLANLVRSSLRLLQSFHMNGQCRAW